MYILRIQHTGCCLTTLFWLRSHCELVCGIPYQARALNHGNTPSDECTNASSDLTWFKGFHKRLGKISIVAFSWDLIRTLVNFFFGRETKCQPVNCFSPSEGFPFKLKSLAWIKMYSTACLSGTLWCNIKKIRLFFPEHQKCWHNQLVNVTFKSNIRTFLFLLWSHSQRPTDVAGINESRLWQ